MMQAVVSTYRKLDIGARVAEANPKELIQMLFDGASAKLLRAKGCINHGDIAGRSDALSGASEIIDGLRNSLDLEQGGDLAKNLDELYSYMIQRLFRANVENDEHGVLEVLSLLSTVSEAWSALDAEVNASSVASV